jgi:replicative DNA helicase
MFGATGTGKSAFALYLESRKINYRIPSIYISLEMDLISTFDRLCAMRRGIPLTSLHPEDGTIQPHIMDQVLDEMAALKRVKSFWFVEETGLCIKDVRSIVKDVKRFMGVDSLNVTIDLFTMLRDFSGKTAAEYEDGVNLMYEMGKQENIHQTWVVQANRKADSTRITSIDQINQLRPNRNTVKNSSAIMERSRIGLGIFRPRFYAETLFPDDPHLETIDDLLEIQLLKQNQGESGEILKYNFRGSVFGISKWVGRAPLSPVVSASSSAPVAGDGST